MTRATKPPVASERTDLEVEIDKFTPRLAKALVKAVPKIQAAVSIYDLSVAIEAGNVERAMALFPVATFRDALTPASKIMGDAFVKGGKMIVAKVENAS